MIGETWLIRLATGTVVTLTAHAEGLPIRLADGSLVYLVVHP